MIERGLRWLALLAVAAGGAAFTWLALTVREDVDDPYWLVQTLVDAEVDAGGAATPIDPKDPLLAQRMIVVTSSINERAAAQVIPRLHYLARMDKRGENGSR